MLRCYSYCNMKMSCLKISAVYNSYAHLSREVEKQNCTHWDKLLNNCKYMLFLTWKLYSFDSIYILAIYCLMINVYNREKYNSVPFNLLQYDNLIFQENIVLQVLSSYLWQLAQIVLLEPMGPQRAWKRKQTALYVMQGSTVKQQVWILYFIESA